MAVYKRGNTYWYEFQFNGERVQESAQTANKEAARQIEAAHRVRLAKGEAGIEEKPPAPTLREFSKDFTKQIHMDCASKPRTIAFYEEKLNRILEEGSLADRRLDAIDEDLIERYKRARSGQESRRGKPLSPASVNRELATLRRLLRMAKDWKRIPSVPKIKLLRGEKSREFVLSVEDEPRYLDALPAGMRPLCTFLVDSGLRVGEALKLEWPQVNLRERPGYVTVRAGHAKSSKARTVDFTPRARRTLESLTGRKGLVFRGADGGPLYHTWLDQQHAAVRTLMGFSEEFVLHSLRHTFGTRLGASGADVRTIMDLMGHASLAVAQKYVHPSTEAKRRAIERMAEASQVPAKVPTELKVVKARKRASGL
jgi:integrase